MNIEQFVYGHCPSGQGFDSTKSSGYQIRARSSGAAPHAEALSAIGTHLGALVHEPEEPVAAENKWLTHTKVLDNYPEDIRKQFPVIWEYQMLGEKVALTRGVYLGLTRDLAKRAGNYVAHSLIFPPELLQKHGYNPLSLQSAPAFPANADSVKPDQMQALKDFGRESSAGCDPRLLKNEPYRSQLRPLLASMMQSVDRKQPVVIVLEDWRQGVPLVGALLQLLPRAFRCGLSFITCETDVRWRSARQAGAGDGSLAEHAVTVMCPKAKGGPTPKPGTLQCFTIFNFATGEHAMRPATRYAEFAAEGLARNDLQLLERHHALAAGLECDLSADACDSLVAIVNPQDAVMDVDKELERQLGIIVPLVKSESQVTAGFQQVRFLLEKVATGQAPPSNLYVKLLNDVLKQCAEEGTHAAPIAAVTKWFQQAFADGRPSLGAHWLDCAGAWRKKVLLGGLSSAIGANPAGGPPEREALAKTLAEGICALAGQPAAPDLPAMDRCLAAFFKVLPLVDWFAASLWDKTESAINGYFGNDLSPDRKNLLGELFSAISPEKSPDAAVGLARRWIEVARPKGDILLENCEIMVRACLHCKGSDNVARWILGVVAAEFTSPPALAMAMAKLAERGWSGPVEDRFYEKYSDVVAQPDYPDRPEIIEGQLLKSKLFHVVCRRFLDRLGAWTQPNSRQQIENWFGKALFPGMEDVFCAVVANQVRKGKLSGNFDELAAWLTRRRPGADSMGPGWVDLYSAVVAGLEACPLAAGWRPVLLPIPDVIDKSLRRRLEFLAFLGDTAQASQSLDWTFKRFDSGNAAWVAYLGDLDLERRKNVVGFVLDCFIRAGLSSGPEAGAFVEVLRTIGDFQAGNIVEWLHAKLADRDTLSQMIVILAFIQLGLARSEMTELCGEVAGGLVREMDKSCRGLIEAHIEKRFAPRTREYQDRLDQLCLAAGFRQPQPPEPKPEPGSKSEGILGKFRFFGKKG
jgi:hypothetical protein